MLIYKYALNKTINNKYVLYVFIYKYVLKVF